VRPTKSKSASDTDSAERVQAVGIGKSLIFGCRLFRIAGASRLPMMMLDARNYRVDFRLWETTLGEHVGRQSGASLCVIVSIRPVAYVVQQRSGFNHVRIGTRCRCDENRQIADSKRVVRVMPRRLIPKVPLHLQF